MRNVAAICPNDRGICVDISGRTCGGYDRGRWLGAKFVALKQQ